MGGFLVPANTKKGTLIFSMFRPIDMIILCAGLGVSFIMLALAPSTTDPIGVMIIAIPGAVCLMLVMPLPNYHNVMTLLISMLKFFTGRRRFIWKGWCFYEQLLKESSGELKK